MTDVKKLRELAENATPGEWRVSMSGYSVKSNDPDVPIIAAIHGGAHATGKQIERWLPNADLIAAANPAAVIALLDRLEAAEAVCAEAEHPAHCDEGVLPLDVTQAMAARLATWRRIRDGQGGGDGTT